jgi:hypothetical protein
MNAIIIQICVQMDYVLTAMVATAVNVMMATS